MNLNGRVEGEEPRLGNSRDLRGILHFEGVLNWMLEGLAKLRADNWQLRLNAAQQAVVDDLLLESDGHTIFVKNALERVDGADLTVQECFAAYAEYCNERGWTTLARNKFGQLIGDIVTRQHRLTVRHDILDINRKSQRGWRGLKLRDNSTSDRSDEEKAIILAEEEAIRLEACGEPLS
jgi:phage/plasmid-associated DNA primase